MTSAAWDEPGIAEVSPDVYRIPLPLPGDGLRAVNVYAVADGDQAVLVDSGWALAESRDRLEKALAEIGYGLRDVREFLVTHIHRDHYTQAVVLRRAFGSTISLGEGERASVDVIREAIRTGRPPEFGWLRRAGGGALGESLAHRRDPMTDDWEPPDTWLAAGVELPLARRTLRVVATPGHTHGHVVFYDDAAGLLFAGDHVLPHITPSIGFEPARPESPLGDYLGSLRLVRSMPDATLLPAHGPAGASVHARIDELLDHHEARLTATATAVEGGASTAYEVAGQLRWTRRERRFADLDVFNQLLATTETMAHLDVLVARGWLAVETTSADRVARYRRA